MATTKAKKIEKDINITKKKISQLKDDPEAKQILESLLARIEELEAELAALKKENPSEPVKPDDDPVKPAPPDNGDEDDDIF